MKGSKKVKKPRVDRMKPEKGHFKFNADGAAKGKSGPAGIEVVVHDNEGRTRLIFSESVEVMESNEAELRAIRHATFIWASIGIGNLIIEGESANAIAWVSEKVNPPGN